MKSTLELGQSTSGRLDAQQHFSRFEIGFMPNRPGIRSCWFLVGVDVRELNRVIVFSDESYFMTFFSKCIHAFSFRSVFVGNRQHGSV
jgi:hypothetical protein